MNSKQRKRSSIILTYPLDSTTTQLSETTLQSKESLFSLSTIINRARAGGYYKEKPPKKVHDRVVLSDYVGELVQHDTSIHQWSPYMKEKLYLITSLDDYSRVLLYAELFTEESTWHHIAACKQNCFCSTAYLKSTTVTGTVSLSMLKTEIPRGLTITSLS